MHSYTIYYFLYRDVMHSHNLVYIPITKTLDHAMLWVSPLIIDLPRPINCHVTNITYEISVFFLKEKICKKPAIMWLIMLKTKLLLSSCLSSIWWPFFASCTSEYFVDTQPWCLLPISFYYASGRVNHLKHIFPLLITSWVTSTI